jgi:hypothetical protein
VKQFGFLFRGVLSKDLGIQFIQQARSHDNMEPMELYTQEGLPRSQHPLSDMHLFVAQFLCPLMKEVQLAIAAKRSEDADCYNRHLELNKEDLFFDFQELEIDQETMKDIGQTKTAFNESIERTKAYVFEQLAQNETGRTDVESVKTHIDLHLVGSVNGLD